MHVGKTALDAVVIEAEALMVHAQQVQHGGMQVIDRRDILYGLVTEVIGGAMAESALHPRAYTRARRRCPRRRVRAERVKREAGERSRRCDSIPALPPQR